MAIRNIIRIDEDKCDGCGQCVTGCAEGALRIVAGKARLVSETYCDGLGACLGKCPRGAITVEQREAPEFDEAAVQRHLRQQAHASPAPAPTPRLGGFLLPLAGPGGGCPGARSQSLSTAVPEQGAAAVAGQAGPPQLRNWPVQLGLVPVQAPYFQNARLLLAADCVPFALPDFHQRLLKGRVLLIACPKLDPLESYRRKLPQLLAANSIQSIEIAFMEVPCCTGLVHLVREALAQAGRSIPVQLIRIGIRGEILSQTPLEPECAVA